MRDDRRGTGSGDEPFDPRRGVGPDRARARTAPSDEELLNALSTGMSVSAPGVGGYDAEDRVAAMLAAWKAEVDSEPIPELVDLETAVATVTAASRRRPSRRARHLVPLAGAAAFLVLAVGGVSVGAQAAEPGDVLFPITKVLYQEQAKSAEAVVVVQEASARARELLAVGDVAGAANALAVGQQAVAVIRDEDGRDALARELEFLDAKAEETPPGVPADLTSPPSNRPDPRTAAGQPGGVGVGESTTSDPRGSGVSTSRPPSPSSVPSTPAPSSTETTGTPAPTPSDPTTDDRPEPTTTPQGAESTTGTSGTSGGTASGPAGTSPASSTS
ncbi:MAG TPA: anti-sigma-D factor RsdA [Pseudonocardia sp.]|nr:anti-sigma-D factor RsdA [Pseudonocardia sp.]